MGLPHAAGTDIGIIKWLLNIVWSCGLDTDQWPRLMNTAVNFVSIKGGEFLDRLVDYYFLKWKFV
jgi:hypothetical protein